jgi:branched-chain amino acid transport system ATP-binding protein
VQRWFTTFPRLEERRTQPAGNLSGGEQQMLAIARGLMSRPRLLLLDEPSLGLAPLITQDLFHRLRAINEEMGTAMLIVEQNANLALAIATRAYVLETGSIISSGPASEVQQDDAVRKAYLGY